MSRARQVANFDPALFAADEVSGDKVSGGTIGAGVIGASVTGGAGLSGSTSLGTVTTGTLGSGVTFPTGHIIKCSTAVSAVTLDQTGTGITAEADANDITVTCVAGNKLHIWIIGGFGFNLSSAGYFGYGVRIKESLEDDIDIKVGALYSRANDYKNDTTPSVMYTHTAVTTSVTVKRFVYTDAAFDAQWAGDTSTNGIRYLVMEEQV